MLESLGVDVVWIPYVESIYPPGYRTWVAVDEITQPLEGKARPGHFRGVATIVAKLFNCFTPDKAYFGQKDAQQVSVLKRMAQDLNFPVELVICPTVRDSDGLALSSRNAYLNPQERKAAPVLYRALCAASRLFEKGERNADALRETMLSELHSELFAREEYVSAADPDTMKELETISDAALLSMAVRIGATRLIDNVLLRVKQQ
jgi:pantoate--beta-alanine ligase